MKHILICLLISTAGLVWSHPLKAQHENHMILKKGYKDRLHFLTGDQIIFMRDSNDFYEGGPIAAIGEDFIYVNGDRISIGQIKAIQMNRTMMNYAAGGSIIQAAAPAYLLLAFINALLLDIRPIISIRNIITAGSLFGFGSWFKSLETREFKLGKRYYLIIVPSDPAILRSRGV